MPSIPEALAAYLTPFVPRDYSYLLPSEELQPADLVTIGAALAWMHDLKREDLAGWYRPLALALFERFGLLALPQRRAIQELTSGVELFRALGIVESPDWFDGLGRAWYMRNVADDLSAHARSANALTRKLDRAIVALWGCPVDRLDQRVTVAELVSGGLVLQTFEP
ncbi:hypothetical protein ACN47A_01400 [Myxococcus fulvus]|uniref:hypothetical protein n=1 Tax=Myxococcus fulvus TaxID=33 RepID=UPI003B9CCE90